MEPPTARSLPMAVMAGNQLLTFGGDSGGEGSREICLADVSNLPGPLAWQEPKVAGDLDSLPSARKGMAGVKKGSTIYLFSGMAYSEKGGYVGSDEMYAVTVSGGKHSFSRIKQKGMFKPEARAGASLRDYNKETLLLTGGSNVEGKPFFDAWTFNVGTCTWACVFNGHSDLAAPAGVLTCMADGHLATVNAAPGSSKLDVCASLDFVHAKAEQEFVTKMKASGAEMLAGLQRWADEQQRGLTHPIDEVKGDFKKLLETMAALYNLRTHGASKELLIDQMQVQY